MPEGEDKNLEESTEEVSFEALQKAQQDVEDFRQNFFESSKQNAEYSKYERLRKVGKQNLKDMVSLYKHVGSDDSDFMSIVSDVEELSNSNATSSKNYSSEVSLSNSILKKIDKYYDALTKEETKLNSAYKKVFFKNGQWMGEEEIQNNPKLYKLSTAIEKRQNQIDNIRLAISDISNLMELQRDGNLIVPRENEIDKSQFMNTSGQNIKTNVGSLQGMSLWRYEKSLKDKPLFPHEPNTNDIRQGNIGNCFMLASLSSLASTNPEEIKDCMRDNRDGTVTVRLFSKDKEGKHKPLYVTVDKVAEIDTGDIDNAKNSTWVNCMERAIVLSGLVPKKDEHGNEYWEPVPDNIQKIYEDFKTHGFQGKDPNELAKEYPWIFTKPEDGVTQKLIPWPNLEYMNGGHAERIGEILMGDSYEESRINLAPRDEIIKGVGYTGYEINLFNQIKENCDGKHITTAGTDIDTKLLSTTHAFTLLNAYEKDGVKYVRLRNPWGDVPLANNGLETTDNGVQIITQKANKEEGIFDMEFKEFISEFESVSINGLNRFGKEITAPDGAKGERFKMQDSRLLTNTDALENYLFADMFLKKKGGAEFLSSNEGRGLPTNWTTVLTNDYAEELGLKNQVDKQIVKNSLSSFRINLQSAMYKSMIGPDKKPTTSKEQIANNLVENIDKIFPDTKLVEMLKESVMNSAKEIKERIASGKLKEQSPNEATFQKLKEEFDAIPKDDPSEGVYVGSKSGLVNKQPKITEMTTDEKGINYVCLDGSNDKIPFDSICSVSNKFTHKMSEAKYEKEFGKPKAEVSSHGPINGNTVNPKTFTQYIKSLSDIDSVLNASRFSLRHTSDDFKEMRAGLKTTLFNLSTMKGRSNEEFQAELNKLKPLVSKYKEHCQNDPKTNSRRETRLKAADLLEQVVDGFGKDDLLPVDKCKANYASKIAKALNQNQNLGLSKEKEAALAKELLSNEKTRGLFTSKNIFVMNFGGEKEAFGDFVKNAKEIDKFKQKNEQSLSTELQNKVNPVVL